MKAEDTMTRKVFLNLLMVCILAFGFVPIVHAEGPSVAPKDRHSGLDPNYKPTQAELDKSAAKEKAAEEYANVRYNPNDNWWNFECWFGRTISRATWRGTA
jgi:hypothetical protein